MSENSTDVNPDQISRRRFLGAAGGFAATALVAPKLLRAQTAGGPPLNFWDTPWGSPTTAYINEAKKITQAYQPTGGLNPATYQSVPWTNWLQQFTSAVAAKTGPAVSSGGAYQAIYFDAQNAIAPADHLIATMHSNGMAADYLPGILESLKYKNHYVAIPWLIDVRVLWYRNSLLQKAGVSVPTDWDSLRTAGLALKKLGISGFGLNGGSGGNANQPLVAMLINNGGGLFDPAGNPNCVTKRNIETVDFLMGLSKDGIIQQQYATYTPADLQGDIDKGLVALVISSPTGPTTGKVQSELALTSPLVGPHGDKGTIYWINNLMMYKNTPSQASSEAFMLYYLKNIHLYWKTGLFGFAPVLKSVVNLPIVQKNANLAKAVAEWVPVGKTLGSLDTDLFPALNAVDGGPALVQWAQAVIEGTESPKSVLQTLQTGLQAVMKS